MEGDEGILDCVLCGLSVAEHDDGKPEDGVPLLLFEKQMQQQ